MDYKATNIPSKEGSEDRDPSPKSRFSSPDSITDCLIVWKRKSLLKM